jgi:hypothetical protein
MGFTTFDFLCFLLLEAVSGAVVFVFCVLVVALGAAGAGAGALCDCGVLAEVVAVALGAGWSCDMENSGANEKAATMMTARRNINDTLNPVPLL